MIHLVFRIGLRSALPPIAVPCLAVYRLEKRSEPVLEIRVEKNAGFLHIDSESVVQLMPEIELDPQKGSVRFGRAEDIHPAAILD